MKLGICGLLLLWPALAAAKGSLLDKLPGKAQVVIGLTRDGSADEVLAEVRKLPLPKEIPPCVLEVYAKVEGIALAIDAAGGGGGIAAHGAGLKPAIEACIAAAAPGTRIEKEGRVW